MNQQNVKDMRKRVQMNLDAKEPKLSMPCTTSPKGTTICSVCTCRVWFCSHSNGFRSPNVQKCNITPPLETIEMEEQSILAGVRALSFSGVRSLGW